MLTIFLTFLYNNWLTSTLNFVFISLFHGMKSIPFENSSAGNALMESILLSYSPRFTTITLIRSIRGIGASGLLPTYLPPRE